MIIREAEINDIKSIMVVRFSVKENTLSNPELVTEKDCVEYLFNRGKGWVCECDSEVIGFAIVDLKDNNVWALFIKPEFENRGIGKKLHNAMIDWYFTQTQEKVWLGTLPNTRAEKFYRQLGWKEVGIHGKRELKFEMTYKEWTMN